MNSIDPHIQFTTQDLNTDVSMPFLDTLVTPGPDNTFSTMDYRKIAHNDQYLHWDNYHNLSEKYNVLTSSHTEHGLFVHIHSYYKRRRNISKGLFRGVNFPVGCSAGSKLKNNHRYKTNNHNNQQAKNKKDNYILMVVPYTKTLSESFKYICNNLGIQVHFKGGNIIKKLLVGPRTETPSHRKMERYKCDRV